MGAESSPSEDSSRVYTWGAITDSRGAARAPPQGTNLRFRATTTTVRNRWARNAAGRSPPHTQAGTSLSHQLNREGTAGPLSSPSLTLFQPHGQPIGPRQGSDDGTEALSPPPLSHGYLRRSEARRNATATRATIVLAPNRTVCTPRASARNGAKNRGMMPALLRPACITEVTLPT